jgi:hypothetical protein
MECTWRVHCSFLLYLLLYPLPVHFLLENLHRYIKTAKKRTPNKKEQILPFLPFVESQVLLFGIIYIIKQAKNEYQHLMNESINHRKRRENSRL